jgi:hypothetical protein
VTSQLTSALFRVGGFSEALVALGSTTLEDSDDMDVQEAKSVTDVAIKTAAEIFFPILIWLAIVFPPLYL